MTRGGGEASVELEEKATVGERRGGEVLVARGEEGWAG